MFIINTLEYLLMESMKKLLKSNTKNLYKKIYISSVSNKSTAEKVLIRRALSCSFSSVFHLGKAGQNAEQFCLIKNVFIYTIIIPSILCIGYGSFVNRNVSKT